MSRLRPLPSWIKSVVLILATVVLYVATARFGLALALPPEKKATAVWLPSGIALAAILIGGWRIWPGVWLGAFIANVWDIFSPGNQFSVAAHLTVSCGIAVGSTLQPLLGAYLLHRWIGLEGLFDGAKSVFKFAGITVLTCVVAPTIGVTMLIVTGLAPWAKFAFAWWTWWVGDLIGILIVTPLVLSWRRFPWFALKPLRMAEATLLLGLLLGVTLFVFGGWELWGIIAGTLTYLTVPLLVWPPSGSDNTAPP